MLICRMGCRLLYWDAFHCFIRGVKVVRRNDEIVFSDPITKEKSAEISGFIKTFYPQLIFAKADGKAVLRERARRKRGLISRRKIGG